MNFKLFFETATNGQQPFPYQERFATAPNLFELVHAPTGSGKTAAAILGWLWRRRCAGEKARASTPRRLVYCLPMRVLVEQTTDAAKTWVGRLGWQHEIKVHVLMGGEDTQLWDLQPEAEAILMGTQDMLLSRALNRGYGMSRFRWPMHFGLLNNDCLWVLDEIQLMGVGLATSAQLQAFRQRFGTYGQSQAVWMSATLLPSWLETADFRLSATKLRTLALSKADYDARALKERWHGMRPIEQAKASTDDPDAVAGLIKEEHLPGSLTLVVVNTLERSRALFDAIQKILTDQKSRGSGKKTSQPTQLPAQAPDVRLFHSRFRPMERETWMGWLKATPPAEGRIVVSTQVVEAGVDMSARTLFTELAPWPSLVQRFGRCNRRGEFTKEEPAGIYWVDVRAEDDKKAAPYTKYELDEARKRLKKLTDAGLKSLHHFFEGLSDKGRAERS